MDDLEHHDEEAENFPQRFLTALRYLTVRQLQCDGDRNPDCSSFLRIASILSALSTVRLLLLRSPRAHDAAFARSISGSLISSSKSVR